MGKEFRIELKFNTGMNHITPDVRRSNPGWGDEKLNLLGGIDRLKFHLPEKIEIHMVGFERYNFFIEATQDFGARTASKIEAFWFMGQYTDKKGRQLVRSYCVQFRNNIITTDLHMWGREYFGTASRGWKDGVKGATPRAGILQDGKRAA